MSLQSKILGVLVDKLDANDYAKVWNYELHRGDKELAVRLKSAGDALEAKSMGWVRRRFDVHEGYHYCEMGCKK